MPSTEQLTKYARLLVRTACNLEEGQELFVSADVTQAPLTRLVVAEAYAAGASNVTVRYTDEQVSRLGYDARPVEAFQQFPDWLALLQNGVANRGAALLFITSSDPLGMAGVDPRKVQAFQRAAVAACPDWRNGMDFGRNVWVIAGGASPAWAQRVFPDLDESVAVERLWEAILFTARADVDDPEAAWRQHDASFQERCAWLNEQRFTALRYTNSLGTDLTVGLTPKSIWAGGGETTVAGRRFFPNVPTEEIYTSPDCTRVDGTVVASMPLNHGGALVRDFRIRFEAGRAVEWSAAEGEDVLTSIIETDEGAHYLGECALVPFGNPIQRTGVLFLNTLFDENAACHLALGRGFAECYEGGRDMSAEELREHGINESVTHVDFMIGTDDLCITGICADGSEAPVFANGVWAE
ncbi:MAG: aminopeptidase [Coriobacteriia bacterium]|nr:aminopeptidase [Coriobacteriia bacterium]